MSDRPRPAAGAEVHWPADLAAARRVVYDAFAATGAPPSPVAAAAVLGVPVGDVLARWRELAARHQLVLEPAGDMIRMAHPFSTRPMGFVLRATDDRMWWGGCAWDSFGVVAALGEELEVITRCRDCGTPLAFTTGPNLPPPDLTVRLPRPAAEWWDDVVRTCGDIRLFCDPSHARRYVARHGLPDGALVEAGRMWRLASVWYGDRLDPDYAPQTTQQRQRQLTDAGLTGGFWTLPDGRGPRPESGDSAPTARAAHRSAGTDSSDS